jgi:imidazolonepropionase-like amidohydrolase
VVDGPNPVWPGSTAVATEADARQAVRDRKAQGMDFVKVYEFIARDHYFALMDEAKRVGIPVVGHVPQAITAAEASDAGQRCIEHLSGSVDEGGAADLAARFKRNGTWVCPTFAIDWTFALRDDPSVAGRPELKYLPSAVVKVVQLPVPHPGADAAMRQLRRKAAVLRVMREAGVPVLAGTDCPMAVSVPGFSLHDELRLLVREAGFTPAEALRAATISPARFLGRERDMGSVAVGNVADLVLLDADPLEVIENARKIAAVVADGRLFDRKELDQIMADVRKDAAADRLDQRTAEELLKDVIRPAGQ